MWNGLRCMVISGRVSLVPGVVEVTSALANVTHKILAYNLRITPLPSAVDQFRFSDVLDPMDSEMRRNIIARNLDAANRSGTFITPLTKCRWA